VSRESPAVHGEDPDRNAGEEAGETTEYAGLRAAGMEDVRSLAPQQADQLEEAGEIAPGADGAPDAPQRKEANTGSGPDPCAATATSKWPTSAGSSDAT
jgi:hypothetical protein